MTISEQTDQFIDEEKSDPHVKGYALAKKKLKRWVDDQAFPLDDIHDIIADAYAEGWIDYGEINEKSSQFIAENGGNTRDALNVALTRLEQMEMKLAAVRANAQMEVTKAQLNATRALLDILIKNEQDLQESQ